MWLSKLQTEVSISTLHAKYMDLYQSMRYFLPLKTLCVNFIKGLGLDSYKLKYNTKSQVFEENSDALQVSKCHMMTPGSKLISFKYHRFRYNIQNGECTVENIGGDLQKADIFTKVIQV